MFWLFPVIMICTFFPLQGMENALGEIRLGEKPIAPPISPLYVHLKQYHSSERGSLFLTHVDNAKTQQLHDKWLNLPSKHKKSIKLELLLFPGYTLKLTRQGVTLDAYNSLFGISSER